MTDLSRGARSRRGGRRPGWLLLSVLLVLALAASSALVFTDRVELLKLAVILPVWAAVVAAFVSLNYRRQSDIDRARARDLKLVYDLQLDREISARREYELEVESQLRRELSSEYRAQAADEVAALRAELAALRNNLEIMFDTDLSQRPAIEQERTTVRAYSDWQRDTDPGQRIPRFVAPTPRQEADDGSENAIIDVPEEPPQPEDEVRAEPFQPQPQRAQVPQPEPVEGGGRHGLGRGADQEWRPVPSEGEWMPAGAAGSNWVPPTNGTSPTPHEAIPAPSAEMPRARHSSPQSSEQNNFAPPPPPQQPMQGAPDEAARGNSQHGEGQGQSVAELLARLQSGTGATGGGRRRRRDG